ncbi:DNA-directed RNA polymerase subunit beta [Myxococcota bacterium]|nr:DNA-directed RNA polymerase subunit beta [Myxococcota bacterium]
MVKQEKPIGLRHRYNFGRIPEIISVPHLIRVQKESYDRFLQKDVPPERRGEFGLQGIFKSIFPIGDYNKTATLDFVRYLLDDPKYGVEECRQRGITYASPMRVTVRLVIWDVDPDTAVREIRDVKEQEVYFGEIPLMTENGTFIINGAERVVVSQLHRSPGVFYESDKGRTHASGKLLYSARVIPNRGSWVDFEFDHKDILHVRIDRRRKIQATVLLKALGYSTQEILSRFYPIETIRFAPDGTFWHGLNPQLMENQRLGHDVLDPATGQVLFKKNDKMGRARIKRMLDAGITELRLERSEVVGKVLADDVVDEESGEILFECNQEITDKVLTALQERGVQQVDVLYIDGVNYGPYLRNTLMLDKVESPLEAAVEIYRRQRPGDPTSPEQARAYFNSLFFSSARYDLSPVGRLKMNFKFNQQVPLDQTTLLKEDFFQIIQYLLDLRMGKDNARLDDIDQLSNRRVRAVGELMENQFRIGMVRMERAIREKMTMSPDLATLMPHDLVNAKPVSAVLKEYFGASQLSQFMDQTNPLSEITNKRRLSALGPGGLTRDRAGFEVRDVHATHYGRVCPIETPEGPNIGLISSLSTYARVNSYGFIETPYRVVREGVVTDEVVYLTAMEEEDHTIAQAGIPLGPDGRIAEEYVQARRKEDFVLVPASEVTLIDVSPAQLVSVAAALIPFLEHDDANRALMGSNMMRQGVPLLRAEAPLVGTGLEWVVARDSGNVVYAKNAGIVESVDANRIVVRRLDGGPDGETRKPDIYTLIKYRRSNQNTCINQVPRVRKGQRVEVGQVLADGSATESGDLALGQNVVVAFMPWGGYNFEDSILMSEKLLHEDYFTSIHIEEFECVARDTKLGKEETTRDIPNVSEDALKDLDASGIVRIGAEVKTGDILVGKITPKGETQLSPEEKLLRAIFGEKAADVRDTSLKVPPGVQGIVVGAKVFSRKGADVDDRSKELEEQEIARLMKDRDDEIRVTKRSMHERLVEVLTGKVAVAAVNDSQGRVLIRKGATLTAEMLQKLPLDLFPQVRVKDDEGTERRVAAMVEALADQVDFITKAFHDRVERLRQGDELPPGVIKTVKVYVAIRRKIQVGDKMAGRHGNKGVLSRLLPVEDMPYLADGTPVDIVLNPLGVPSRMNVGQILEVHLGWAARELGRQLEQMIEDGTGPKGIRKRLMKLMTTESGKRMIKEMDDDQLVAYARQYGKGLLAGSPVFDGAQESEIKTWLEEAGLPTSGKTVLFDGRTGEAFDSEVTVGVMYMMKLHHLVDEKMHARSTGPYSLVTQQPLGGKAQFGGQRIGEMEVWAFEAYGAAYSLQEILTVKSDDVAGRTATYDSIVKGEYNTHAGLPESFNVLVKELKSLALDVQLVEQDQLAEG